MAVAYIILALCMNKLIKSDKNTKIIPTGKLIPQSRSDIIQDLNNIVNIRLNLSILTNINYARIKSLVTNGKFDNTKLPEVTNEQLVDLSKNITHTIVTEDLSESFIESLSLVLQKDSIESYVYMLVYTRMLENVLSESTNKSLQTKSQIVNQIKNMTRK